MMATCLEGRQKNTVGLDGTGGQTPMESLTGRLQRHVRAHAVWHEQNDAMFGK